MVTLYHNNTQAVLFHINIARSFFISTSNHGMADLNSLCQMGLYLLQACKFVTSPAALMALTMTPSKPQAWWSSTYTLETFEKELPVSTATWRVGGGG